MPVSRTRISSSVPARRTREHDASARVGVLGGVVEQVAQHLREAREVALDFERLLGHLDRRAHAAAR